MNVTRLSDAERYEVPKHHGMSTLRLQGGAASGLTAFTIGLSIALPAGGAEHGSSPRERVYVVVEGELTVLTDGEEIVLRPLDSVAIAPGEDRTLENRTNRPVLFLVVMTQTD